MDSIKKISPVGESWSEYRKKHYTAEEIAENDLMVKLVGEVIKTRKEKHISQRELEDMTGVINNFKTTGIHGKNACDCSAGIVRKIEIYNAFWGVTGRQR